MKKLSAIILSVLMMFSALSITAYAADVKQDSEKICGYDPLPPVVEDEYETKDYRTILNDNGVNISKADYIGVIKETNSTAYILVHATGFPVLTGITYEDIGDFEFSSAINNPDQLGAYVVRFDKEMNEINVSLLKDSMYEVSASEVCRTIRKAREKGRSFELYVTHKDGEKGEKCFNLIEAQYGAHVSCRVIGENDDYTLAYALTETELAAPFSEIIGGYEFSRPQRVASNGFGLFIVKDDNVYPLDQAYSFKIINDNDIEKIAADVNKAEIAVKAKKYEKNALIEAIEEEFGEHDHYREIGEYSGSYLVNAWNDILRPADFTERIGNYTFRINCQVGRYELGLYIVKDGKAYTLKQAYDDGIINASDVEKIAQDVKKAKVVDYVAKDIEFDLFEKIRDKYGVFHNYKVIGKYSEGQLVAAYNNEENENYYKDSFGGYMFSNIHSTDKLGLYYVLDSTVCSLKEAYETKRVDDNDLAQIVKELNAAEIGIEAKYTVDSEIHELVKKKDGEQGFYTTVGKIDGFYLVFVTNKWIGPMPYTEKLGDYEFKIQSYVANYPLGLYVVKDDSAYTLKEAYDKKVISGDNLKEIAKLTDGKGGIEVYRTAVNDILAVHAQKIKVKVNNKTVKASKLKKQKVTFKAVTIKNAKGKINAVKLKKGTSAKIYKKISVNGKTGAVTLKKGSYAKKTYRIKLKITVKATPKYLAATVYKTVKVKVK